MDYLDMLTTAGGPQPLAAATLAATVFAIILSLCLLRRPLPKAPAARLAPVMRELTAQGQKLDELARLVRAGSGTRTCYASPSGRKLHANGECTTLRSAVNVETVEINTEALAFLMRVDAVCDRCKAEFNEEFDEDGSETGSVIVRGDD